MPATPAHGAATTFARRAPELHQPEEASNYAKRVLAVSPGCSISRDVLQRARAALAGTPRGWA